MNIYIRKVLLFVSYTAFVIIAPLVILYAIGYRPQASSPIPRPVGVILVDATPGKASVSVNGELRGTLPRSIPNMEPGTATVQVLKDGYTTWEKNLEIKPTQATDIRSIQLLPAVFEKDILSHNVTLFSQSPNNLFIAAVTNKNTLVILDDVGVAILPKIALAHKPTAIAWSPDSSHILLTLPKNTYEILRLQNAAVEKIPAKQIAGIMNPAWSAATVNTLYGLDKNHSLISYTVSTGSKETLIKNVTSYELANRTIYFQTADNQLIAKQVRSGDERTVIQDTEKNINKIAVSNTGTLALLFSDGELILLKENNETILISPSAQDAFWSPDGQLLLVQTAPTELSVFNVKNERLFSIPLGQLHLITRLSQPITHPQWFSDSLHIFYQTNNSIFFSEIDTRDHPIALPIDTTTSAMPITIGDQSKNIMYIKKEGVTSSLQKTWLLTEEDR